MNQLEMKMEMNFTEAESLTVSILYEKIADLEEQLERSEKMCKKWKDLVIVFHDQIHKMIDEQGYRPNSH